MAKKLTKSRIESIQPPASGAAFLFDTEVRGFGIRTTSRAVQSFIWQGRVYGHKIRITIGRFGDITADQARAVAKQIAGEVAAGKDPRAERQRREAEKITLRHAFNEYLANRQLKERTRADIKRAQSELSDWMTKPVIKITRDMVARRHRKIGAKAPAYANLVMRYLRAALNHASEANALPDGRPLLIDNPVNGLSATRSWYRIKPRRTYLAPHELPKWVTAVDGLAMTPERPAGGGRELPRLRNGDIARDFFMLVLLTGLRRSEALNLRWADVDLDGRLLTIPDPKNHEAHTLPLSNYLFSMLKRRHERAASKFVFADDAGTRFTNFRCAMNRIEKISGLRATCHDLRRTFATVAESLDVPAYAVKGLLNHKTSGDVTAGYIQITPDRLRQPMQRITDYILEAGGIRQRQKVYSIHKSTNLTATR